MSFWGMRAGVAALALVQFTTLVGLSWARYSNVHQRTFDLALYARIAWGLAHGDGWSPVLNSHALGAHVSPVLFPLGLLGRCFGVVPVLLAAQAGAIALSVWPIARIGFRRMGPRGALLGAAAWLLYPNLTHVGSYEFHPGTLAVLPMAWALDALDRKALRALALACFGVLLCREDLGAFCILAALLFYGLHRERGALALSAACAAYTLLGVWLTTAHAPENDSLGQHFGVWGGSPLGLFRALHERPDLVWAHFSARERLTYLPQVLGPLAFMSLGAPGWLLPALPYLALNMLSEFPTAHQQYSHYLTPAVPTLIASALVGLSRLSNPRLQWLWLAPLALGQYALGGLPLSRGFEQTAFVPDAATRAARRVLAGLPAAASVQAPDPLLPHLVERDLVTRAPPPERGTDYVVLDVSHRQRYALQEDLLRTSEEPEVRHWLARPDHGLLVYAPPYALLARGIEPRSAQAVRRYFDSVRTGQEFAPKRLSRCLALTGAELEGHTLTLSFFAHGACPADLALHLGESPVPTRTDLLFDGALSPAHLRAGDRVWSKHSLSPAEAARFRSAGLHLSLVRESGARPEPADPVSVAVPLP